MNRLQKGSLARGGAFKLRKRRRVKPKHLPVAPGARTTKVRDVGPIGRKVEEGGPSRRDKRRASQTPPRSLFVDWDPLRPLPEAEPKCLDPSRRLEEKWRAKLPQLLPSKMASGKGGCARCTWSGRSPGIS